MRKINILVLLGVIISLFACEADKDLEEIIEPPEPGEGGGVISEVILEAGSADFSNYIATGASFTAGFSDGALFIKGQENSFPNILASKFAMAGGGEFSQPLMADNIGGMIFFGNIPEGLEPRLILNIEAGFPQRLDKTPTTQLGDIASNAPNFNNYGVPGVKSFHYLAPGYGSIEGLTTDPLTANPYYVRMNPTQPTLLEEVVSKKATFFTLSEVGGNDVLDYALSGGTGVNQGKENNIDPSTYKRNDITNPAVFSNSFSKIVESLTKNGAKGVVTTIPNITLLPHFTTVPYNPLDPEEFEELKEVLPTLNKVYGFINESYKGRNDSIDRAIRFDPMATNPVIIFDEDLENLSNKIRSSLISNKNFREFVSQATGVTGFILSGVVAAFANILGNIYGKSRPATDKDLFILSSALVIGTVNEKKAEELKDKGLPKDIAAQLSNEGITLPLEDKWVLTSTETEEIKTATDAYNASINAAAEKDGLAVVSFGALLNEALTGIKFDEFTLNTKLVFGGLFSLDGIHLTARGYALMANKILEAIDDTYGSNFKEATNGLAKAKDFVTNYQSNL
ncbi:MAG: SGNH/GDSL hydrolase family protein [Tenacibaculum sp.]